MPSLSGWALFKGWSRQDVDIPGRGSSPTSRLGVSDDFFKTMGARLVDGRELRGPHEDNATRPIPVVVNTAFARKYFPGERAVGRRIKYEASRQSIAPMEIVGVVDDLRDGSVRGEVGPVVFSPLRDALGTLQYVRRLIRARWRIARARNCRASIRRCDWWT